MIAVTSDLLAVLFDEPDARRFLRTIAEAPSCRMLAANFLEVTKIIGMRAGAAGGHELGLFLEKALIQWERLTVPTASCLWEIARSQRIPGATSCRNV